MNNIPAGYKQTEVGMIPEDWKVTPLSVLTSEVGDGIHSTPIYSNNGEYYFINGNNLVNGKIATTQDTKRTDFPEFKKYKKNLGDRTIFLSINGTIGNIAFYYGEPIILGKSAAYLNIKNEISKRYIYFSLQTESVKHFFEDGLTGTTIKNLGLGTIRKTPIAIPKSEKEQTAIATALSDADALITSLEKLIAKKRNIKQGAMQDLLKPKEGWVKKKLGEVAEVVGGGTPSTFNPSYWNGEINWFTPTEIGDNKYSYESSRRITKEGLASCSAKLLPVGTILLTSRASIGDISILRKEACTNQGFQSLIPKQGCNNEFIYYLMLTLKTLLIQFSSGSTFLEISPNKLKTIEIHIPNYEEQTRIAAILSDMDAEIEALEKKLAKCRRIKQGMMQELLTGRIRLNH